jgi:hypothetical protein
MLVKWSLSGATRSSLHDPSVFFGVHWIHRACSVVIAAVSFYAETSPLLQSEGNSGGILERFEQLRDGPFLAG